MMNKYQEALNTIKKEATNPYYYDHLKWNECFKTLQELVDKEIPMKVDKEHYKLEDCNDCDYFPVSIHLYKCPNPRCKFHRKYEIGFEEKRCPDCNQLLKWSDKDD